MTKTDKTGPKVASPAPAGVFAVAPPVFFFHGDKGGVGKSMAANCFADWMRSIGLPTAVVDADARNPDVSRMWGDVVPTLEADLRAHEGWMDLTDFMLGKAQGCAIVISLPAGIGEHMKKEAPQFFNTVAQLGRGVSMIWLMDRVSDCVNLFRQAFDELGPKMQSTVVMKNLFRGDADKFGEWDHSETRVRFLAAGGREVSFTELNWRTRSKLFAEPKEVIPFSSALVPLAEAVRSPKALSPSENMELDEWLRVNFATFGGLRTVLGLGQ